MNFKDINNKYRPIPFWSWNERLSVEETRRQVRIMREAGIGGFFMHARGGLLTEYMSKEWFDNVFAASDEGEKFGMYPWAYDENGWPSGFGGGAVSGLGEEYQQKALHIEPLSEENVSAEHTVLIKDGWRYYYTVNPFYVDVLDPKVTDEFIKSTHEKYYEKCKNAISGFFTDEPQISRSTGFPWGFTLEEEFMSAYGYSLKDHLDELFFEKGDYVNTRVRFWKLVTELFSKNFFKKIYDWCTERGYGLTGHAVIEESLFSQLMSAGACMPHYEYFTIPGMDWLGREVEECFTPMALSSVAAQLGKRQVLSETYALCGHNVSFGELKRIYEWQMVRGINLLCPHLEGYSLRGIRKRDYPPAMYYQQPWWSEAKVFFDSMSRIGMLLTEGEIVADTLLIHPQTTAWSLYNGDELPSRKEANAKIGKYNDQTLTDMRELERKHILYHLGDEIIMERHGRVEGGRLVIGNMSYSRVVIPEGVLLLDNTKRLLREFAEAGGSILRPEEISANDITEESSLTYTMRKFPDFTLHYFVNTENSTVKASFKRGGSRLDIESGEVYSFPGEYSFEPYESLVLIDKGGRIADSSESASATTSLAIDGEWDIVSSTLNSITLDRCDYSFDNGEQIKGGYVLDILPRINALRRPVALKQTYTFYAECIPNVICLCAETPEIFKISVNGKDLPYVDIGSFRDESFRLIDIKPYTRVGENTVIFESVISQSEKTYRHLANSFAFESMKNSLAYDTEVEQIYIVGSFGAEIRGQITELPRGAYRIPSAPVINKAPATADINKLDMSGYPQFAGTITLKKKITVTDTARHVTLKGKGINAITLSINGKEVAKKLFPPYRVDVSPYLIEGENEFTLTLVGNLRNMQGPFHEQMGENYFVCPHSFYREANVFRPMSNKGEECHEAFSDWRDDICLVHYGMDMQAED